MCKVLVDNSVENIDFIIYNHLFSNNAAKFTVPQLTQELKQYNLTLTCDFVQGEINDFVRLGLLKQNFRSYSVCL